MFTAGAKAIHSFAESMKAQPLAMALVIINVLFLGAAVLVMRDVATNAKVRDAAEVQLLTKVLQDCGLKPNK
jgi:hypothetical protein